MCNLKQLFFLLFLFFSFTTDEMENLICHLNRFVSGAHLSCWGNNMFFLCDLVINTDIWLFSYLQPQRDVLACKMASKSVNGQKNKEKKQTKKNAEAKESNRTKSTMWSGSVIYHKTVEQKDLADLPPRLVWHLTSSSLYTELITVMQRAQFYSNKARERERHWRRNTPNRKETTKKRRHDNISSRQQPKKKKCESCPDAEKFDIILYIHFVA